MANKGKEIKIRLEQDTHDKLQEIARRLGTALAPMILEAAVQKFLGATGETVTLSLGMDQLAARLDKLQKQVDSHEGTLRVLRGDEQKMKTPQLAKRLGLKEDILSIHRLNRVTIPDPDTGGEWSYCYPKDRVLLDMDISYWQHKPRVLPESPASPLLVPSEILENPEAIMLGVAEIPDESGTMVDKAQSPLSTLIVPEVLATIETAPATLLVDLPNDSKVSLENSESPDSTLITLSDIPAVAVDSDSVVLVDPPTQVAPQDTPVAVDPDPVDAIQPDSSVIPESLTGDSEVKQRVSSTKAIIREKYQATNTELKSGQIVRDGVVVAEKIEQKWYELAPCEQVFEENTPAIAADI